MRGKRLASEDGAIVGNGGFKAFGVDALPRKPTLVVAFPSIADARNFSQEVSEPAAEDVAFVSGHLQRFLDGVGEAVVGETKVGEHGSRLDFYRTINLCCSLKVNAPDGLKSNYIVGFNSVLVPVFFSH